MQAVSCLTEVVERAKGITGKRIVIPAAETESALAAAAEARKCGLAAAILIGDRDGLKRRLGLLGEDAEAYQIVHEPDDLAAARRAVAMVRANEAHVILKGRLKTGDLLRAVLNKEEGLRTGNLLSDVLVSENPMSPFPKLIGLADGGMNVAPDLQGKRQILENAVRTFHRLGFECPKVAVLCAVEEPTETMPHTLEARALMAMNESGQIKGCLVCGPLALDNAIWPEAAKLKGVTHPVGGNADILLVPNIEAGNCLGKAFTYFARKSVGHVIEGAAAPILIPSRAESAHDKLISISLGVLCAAGGSTI